MLKTMYKAISDKRLLIRLCITLVFLISFDKAHAHYLANNNQAMLTAASQQQEWRLYPLTIQINTVNQGLLLPVSLVDLVSQKIEKKHLWFWGASVDISILYVKNSIWQYFNAYPRLGLSGTYYRLSNSGLIASGKIYLEPNYNHSAYWEFLPRLGIGLASINVPGHHPKIETKANENKPIPYVDKFRQGISLDLALDFLIKYRITPKWHIHGVIELDYLPAFYNQGKAPKKHIALCNASLGTSYTFNPSPYNYPRPQRLRKSRIDVGILHSFRKAQSLPRPQKNAKHTTKVPKDEYYYIGGLHLQGALQIARNHALTLASEWVQDWAAKQESKERAKKDFLQVGFLAGHEFLWGKFTFGQAVGVYALNDMIAPPIGSFYTRLTLHYYINRVLFMGASLKTAIMPALDKVAEFNYIDFRIGYTF